MTKNLMLLVCISNIIQQYEWMHPVNKVKKLVDLLVVDINVKVDVKR